MGRMKRGCFFMMVLLALCGTLLLNPSSRGLQLPRVR